MFCEKFQKRTKNDRMVTLSVFFEGVTLSGNFPVQRESIFPYEILGNVLGFFDFCDLDELRKAMSIVFQRSRGSPHFDFEVIKERLSLFFEWCRWFLREENHRERVMKR